MWGRCCVSGCMLLMVISMHAAALPPRAATGGAGYLRVNAEHLHSHTVCVASVLFSRSNKQIQKLTNVFARGIATLFTSSKRDLLDALFHSQGNSLQLNICVGSTRIGAVQSSYRASLFVLPRLLQTRCICMPGLGCF